MSINRFVMFVYWSIVQGVFSQDSVDTKLTAVDGEQYIKKLLRNESVSGNPEYLFFTAPYRVCDGGCEDGGDTNFAIAFPLFAGKARKDIYRKMYPNVSKKMRDVFGKQYNKTEFTTCSPLRDIVNSKSTQSTMYPGYSGSTSKAHLRTQSTVYPDYSQRPTIDKLYKYIARTPETKTVYDYEHALKLGATEKEHQLYRARWWMPRRSLSMDDVPSRLTVVWRPTQNRQGPTKPQDSNKMHYKWPPYGLRPVLPIRNER